ncbi:PQQ-binding-like beta-propeller repeat protein [Spirillospora sp. NPDC048819]|uniref:outer membrane protein assembly factor BamB family protein n=1 Tax=Spirillospora sp. NPDC048819 TaxID=3155268 RepID=UPI0033D24627
MARRGAAAVAVMVLMALVAACDGGRTPAGGPTAAPELKRLWDVPFNGPAEKVWTGEGLFAVYTSKDGLRGFDAGTGALRWKLRLPDGADGICGLSDRPNADGIAGVVFRSPQKTHLGNGCDIVGAVDTGDGRLLWSHRGMANLSDVSTGPAVITVTGRKSDQPDRNGAQRLAVRSGKVLPAILPEGKARPNDTFHDGVHVALRRDRGEKASSFTLYDSESGKRLWSTDPAEGTRLHRIIAGDPVTLEVTVDGKRSLRTYDASGEPLRTIGIPGEVAGGVPGRSANGWKTVSGRGPLVSGGVLVTGFEGGPGVHGAEVHAFDLETGGTLWKRPAGEAAVVAVGDDVVLASARVPGEAPSTDPGMEAAGRRLLRSALRGGRYRELGLVPRLKVRGSDGNWRPDDLQVVPFAWDDGRVYVFHHRTKGSAIAAYQLPR